MVELDIVEAAAVPPFWVPAAGPPSLMKGAAPAVEPPSVEPGIPVAAPAVDVGAEDGADVVAAAGPKRPGAAAVVEAAGAAEVLVVNNDGVDATVEAEAPAADGPPSGANRLGVLAAAVVALPGAAEVVAGNRLVPEAGVACAGWAAAGFAPNSDGTEAAAAAGWEPGALEPAPKRLVFAVAAV